jgi:zinc finger protein
LQELQVGTLGGMFTTVEGILQKILSSLGEKSPIVYGDSKILQHSNDPSISEGRVNFEAFLAELALYAAGKKFPFTLVVRDPLGNSFISAPLGTFLPPESDKNLQLLDYERSFEEVSSFGFSLLFLFLFFPSLSLSM